jgi:hypothetical protein
MNYKRCWTNVGKVFNRKVPAFAPSLPSFAQRDDIRVSTTPLMLAPKMYALHRYAKTPRLRPVYRPMGILYGPCARYLSLRCGA